ncbi:The fantastic four family [Heracleum sosnowskyi]|uniref:The fantastic four family n=1 Tax=Heracleum sosnowskyi TaxID=360622 RepID=A0AAD8ILM6_9APIA|nr:The fantastic four family [Heracleum sosnowskyi]
MSSTIVYQSSQSRFESQHTENKPLRLKLAAPKFVGFESTSTKDSTTNQMTENRDSGGWNFLESLSNCSQNPKKTFNTERFHPSLKLSQKSLELCTEKLGSETGSDDTVDIDILSFTSTESKCAKSSTRTHGHVSLAKKANARSFPPPLTTISGSNSIQVRPHREGGRLIIEAVEAPSTRACFEAKRSHGRLQLRFLKNCEFFYDQKMSSKNIQHDNIGESETEDRNMNKEEDIFEEDELEKNNVHSDIVDQERNGGYMKKDMNGIRQDVEVGMGRENLGRHNSRCKESGHGNNTKGLCNWEAFLVAT